MEMMVIPKLWYNLQNIMIDLQKMSECVQPQKELFLPHRGGESLVDATCEVGRSSNMVKSFHIHRKFYALK